MAAEDTGGSAGSTNAPLRAGLTAGAVMAPVASLVNLPLEAPIDTFFNSGSVTLGALLSGVLAGSLWRLLASNERRLPVFVAVLAGAFVLVAALAVGAQGNLDRSVSYAVPLAGVVLAGHAVLVPTLATRLGSRATVLALAAVVVAIGVGGALAGQGDAESGRLQLPPRSAVEVIVG